MPADTNNKKRLSDSLAQKNLQTGVRYTIWDTTQTGLGLRVTSAGKKSWAAKYRVGKGRGGKQKFVTLGSPPTMSCDDARTLAADLISRGWENKDLHKKQQDEAVQENINRRTRILHELGVVDDKNPVFLKTAWKSAISMRTGVTPRYKRNLERLWKHISNEHGDMVKTKDLTAQMLIDLKEKLSDKPGEFNNFRNMLNTVLENEIFEKRLESNILNRVKPYKAKFRDTILSEKGISDFITFYQNSDNFPKNRRNHARFILSLLLTGQRPSMLRNLKKADDRNGNHVNWKKKTMVFRNHKTSKDSNEKAAVINISPRAFDLMKNAADANPNSEYVFSTHDSRKVFSEQPVSERAVQEMFGKEAHRFYAEGTDPLVVYSLRPTFGSMIVNSKDVSILQVSQMMLHKNITTTQRYLKTTEQGRKAATAHIDRIFGVSWI